MITNIIEDDQIDSVFQLFQCENGKKNQLPWLSFMQEHTPDSAHILKFLTIVGCLVHTDYKDEIRTWKTYFDIIGRNAWKYFQSQQLQEEKRFPVAHGATLLG